MSDPNRSMRSPNLLFFFFGFGLRLGRASLRLLLGFGFFHRLTSVFGFLSPGVGAFLALLIQNLFAAEKFDERLVGAVALLPCSANDARVSAITIAEAWTERIE